MAQKWTKKELELLKHLANKMPIREVAQIMNRSYDSVEKKARVLGVYFSNKPKLQELKQDFAKINKELIYQLKDHLSEVHVPLAKKEYNKTKQGDTLVINFTDWHIGRIVRDEEGHEIYNTFIFKERIDKLLSEILGLLDDYIRKGTPIKDVVIISTGDILDGMGIFASQETQSEMSPPFQVMLGVEVIQRFILALLNRKLSVNFYGVRGNHGEIRGEKGKPKDLNANWDMQLYLILDFWVKTILKNNRVKIFYSELDYLNFKIQGWNYHIRHIAPQQSETSAGKAKFLGWAKKHDCDVLIYGHYHHYGISDRSGVTVIRGGSITGADEYSEQLAEESEPIQVIWGVGKHRPVTFMYAIDLGKRKKK